MQVQKYFMKFNKVFLTKVTSIFDLIGSGLLSLKYDAFMVGQDNVGQEVYYSPQVV